MNLLQLDKNRLEAFSDGVMAIIITIMVLGFRVPDSPTWRDYAGMYPAFVSYAVSFLFVGLYWSSHHHLFHAASKVNNKILWVNMVGLFWLSMIPVATASMGASSFSSLTVALYAVLLTLSLISYVVLVFQLSSLHGADSEFARTFRGHLKSYLTIGLNLSAAVISLAGHPRIAFLVLVLTALLWFVPNHRFEPEPQG